MTATKTKTAAIDESFAAFDLDGDGYITWDDCQESGDRVCRAFDVAPGSAKHRKLVTALEPGWQRIREVADADKDGRVSHDEYAKAIHRLGQDSEMLRINRGVLDAVWDIADVDADGMIDREEFRTLWDARGQQNAEADFGRLDEDGDGRITRDEFVFDMNAWGERA